MKSFHEIKIYLVPGDRHCLIFSWEIDLMESEKAKFEPSYDVLHNPINTEF